MLLSSSQEARGSLPPRLDSSSTAQKKKWKKVMTAQDELSKWLNDAHSMEVSIGEVLQKHIKAAEAIPLWHERLQFHLVQTRRHADRIRECIGTLGGTVSQTKTILGDMLGRLEGYSTVFCQDELVKNVLAEYAGEHLEIGCYTALIAAAEELGQTRIAEVCREIKAEEEEMAHWVKQHIAVITKEFLRATSATARP
jgi:ferritin-like metal-binding protein YciE